MNTEQEENTQTVPENTEGVAVEAGNTPEQSVGQKVPDPINSGSAQDNSPKDKNSYLSNLHSSYKAEEEGEFNLGRDTFDIKGLTGSKRFLIENTHIATLNQRYNTTAFSEYRTANDAIILLREQRILVIQAPDESWLEHSVNNLVMAGTWQWPEAELRRILRRSTDDNTELKAKDKFGFWRHCSRLPEPTIIFIDDDNQKYVQLFYNEKSGTIASYEKEKLREANIYLVLMVPDTVENRLNLHEIRTKLKDSQLGWWDVPVLQELIAETYGAENAFGLYDKICSQKIIEKYGQTQLYWAYKALITPPEQEAEWEIPSVDKLVDKLEEQVRLQEGDWQKELSFLKEKFENGDEIEQTVLFCAAFFPNLSVFDFRELVPLLLGNKLETKPEYPVIPDNILASGNNALIQYYIDKHKEHPKSLAEKWKESRTDNIRKQLRLKIFQDGRREKIRFEGAVQLGDRVQTFIHQHYADYFLIKYEHIQETGILFDEKINRNLLDTIVRFIVIAAEKDEYRHNAKWLVDNVLSIKAIFTSDIDTSSLHAFLASIEKNAEYNPRMNFLFNRLTDLIQGMYLSQTDELRTMVADFFKLLIDQREVKSIALKMALTLHKRLDGTPNYDGSNVLEYFKRLFDEGNKEDVETAYNLLKEQFNPNLLLEIVIQWLKVENKNSGTHILSRFYLVEYGLLTFYRFWQDTETTDTPVPGSRYGLLIIPEDGECEFMTDFKFLLNHIASEQNIHAVNKTIHFFNPDKSYRNHLTDMLAEYMEQFISNCPVSKQRLNYPDQGVALTGDILENWFYILVLNWQQQQQNTSNTRLILDKAPKPQPRWKAYVSLICDALLPTTGYLKKEGITLELWHKTNKTNALSQIVEYLLQKPVFYKEVAIMLNVPDNRNRSTQINALRSRNICVQLLTDMIREEFKKQLSKK